MSLSPPFQRLEALRAQFAAGSFAGVEEEAGLLLAERPGFGGAAVLFAECAAARGDHGAALRRWQDCIAQPTVRPPMILGAADALMALGRPTDALDLLARAAADFPGHPTIEYRCGQLLMQLNLRERAKAELATGMFARPAPGPRLDRLRLHDWLCDMPACRQAFRYAFANAERLEHLTVLLAFAPLLFETFDRNTFWLAMRKRVDAEAQPGNAAHAVLAMRLDIALGDYDAFLAHYDCAPALAAPWDARCARLASILRAPRVPDMAAEKVFAIGLSKTGTTSVCAALEQLGYLTAHYLNPFSGVMLTDADAPLFDALGDTPISARFEYFAYAYPNARFILTERPAETWVESLNRQFMRSLGTADFAELRELVGQRGMLRQRLDLARTLGPIFLNHATAMPARVAFEARVEEFFSHQPPGRLLRFNMFEGDSWPELCAFLGRPMPAKPFPWENKGLGKTP